MRHHGDLSNDVPSSPPPMRSRPSNHFLFPSPTSSHRKEKRNPSVTPRRFGRFFTPRSSASLPITGRRILADLDSSSVNRHPVSPESLLSDPLTSDAALCSSPTDRLTAVENDGSKRQASEMPQPSLKRRRRMEPNFESVPQLNLSGMQHIRMATDAPVERPTSQESLEDRRRATLNHFFKASRGGLHRVQEKSNSTTPHGVTLNDSKANNTLDGYEPKPIRKFRNRGFSSQLLDREHGFSSHAGHHHLTSPRSDPRPDTASFYSSSSDVHLCSSFTGPGNTIPFSLASCHNAPVTAIADEQGFVRLFRTTASTDGESKVDAHVKMHDNAVMDVTFSEDDLRLATACGDRTGKILDVLTQSVAVELGNGHWDSLRQVSFQPGEANGNTLATSDRAGRVQIWDLRCSSTPTRNFSAVSGLFGSSLRDATLDPLPGQTVNTIDSAHERTVHGITSPVSVTAIQWMPAGREHLLLTASEANASIKLWDTRYIKLRRQVEDTPLAMTPQPTTHAWRPYGITSMALNSDATRLYAVCKDNTVYAYSTAHLMLGLVPELSSGATKRRPTGSEGLGPLYGFKHDLLRVQSFYVKCAIRPARSAAGQSELLAVGSSDGCAVLFPTDERYLRAAWAQRAHILAPSPSSSSSFPTSSQSFSTPSGITPSSSPLAISRLGTPLIRGHSREVTSLSWSHQGKLVTTSDDYVVRQWQENADASRHLRQVGEFGGERHMAGWADVGDDWDVEDDEG